MLAARNFAVQQGIAAATVVADSTAFSFAQWAGAQVYLSGNAATTLTWYSAPTEDGTFTPVENGSGVAVTSTVGAAMNCLIPAACFGCGWLKAVANNATVLTIHFKG